MFKPDHCSPGNDNNISCIELPLLKKIAKILNQQPECSPININSKQQLYNQIKKEMNKISDCDSESCWILEDKIKNNLSKHEYEMLMDEFRPIEPLSWVKNETEWLNTNDINNVIEQYEIKYPDFKFMGANPIDFNVKFNNRCNGGGELCKIKINDLKKKSIHKIGMVFNIDPSNKPGQHWFSLYVDLKGINRKNIPTIYYFDSAKKINKGNLERIIPKEIQEFVTILQNQDKKLKFLFNDKKHQYKNTECGIYCLHFLTEMLQGKSFRKYVNQKLNDKNMEELRSKFFIERK